MDRILLLIYERLLKQFGPQNWWPAKTQFEVIIGAILTQNTAWQNVEKAICNLDRKKLLSLHKSKEVDIEKLAELIRPSGYYNVKAKRVKNFIDFLFKEFEGDISKMFKQDSNILRNQLLQINGIGPETADSILLYGGDVPVFVVDAYTKRVFSRHGFFTEDVDYYYIQQFFMKNLPQEAKLFNEYHALIVKLAKDYCKRKPICYGCPLKELDEQLDLREVKNEEKDFGG